MFHIHKVEGTPSKGRGLNGGIEISRGIKGIKRIMEVTIITQESIINIGINQTAKPQPLQKVLQRLCRCCPHTDLWIVGHSQTLNSTMNTKRKELSIWHDNTGSLFNYSFLLLIVIVIMYFMIAAATTKILHSDPRLSCHLWMKPQELWTISTVTAMRNTWNNSQCLAFNVIIFVAQQNGPVRLQ